MSVTTVKVALQKASLASEDLDEIMKNGLRNLNAKHREEAHYRNSCRKIICVG